MANFNRVILAGNLTRDPELRFTNNGIPVCNFGIAVNERKSDGEEVAHYFDVTAWRNLGETMANYKSKGDPVLIEGRLNYRSWEADDGSRRSKVDVVAQNVQFLNRSGGNGSNGSSGQGSPSDEEEIDYNDLPF